MENIYQKEIRRVKGEANEMIEFYINAIPALDLAQKIAKRWCNNTEYINKYHRAAEILTYNIVGFGNPCIDIRLTLTINERIAREGFIFLEELLDLPGVKSFYGDKVDFSDYFSIEYRGTRVGLNFKTHNCTYKTITKTETIKICV